MAYTRSFKFRIGWQNSLTSPRCALRETIEQLCTYPRFTVARTTAECCQSRLRRGARLQLCTFWDSEPPMKIHLQGRNFCFIFTGLRSRKTIFSEICSSLRVNAFPLLCPVVRYWHMHRTNSANTFIFNDGLSCKQGFSSGLYTALIGEVLSFRLERQTSSTAAEL